MKKNIGSSHDLTSSYTGSLIFLLESCLLHVIFLNIHRSTEVWKPSCLNFTVYEDYCKKAMYSHICHSVLKGFKVSCHVINKLLFTFIPILSILLMGKSWSKKIKAFSFLCSQKQLVLI